MANVGGRNRGQLIVIGALALAVAIVGLGLVLNFAIYTENLATRDTNPDTRAAVTQQHAAQHSIARAMRHVNVHHAGASVSELEAEHEAELLRLNRTYSSYSATTAGTTEAVVDSSTAGKRMAQNATNPFVDAAGDANWTLATAIPTARTGRFRQTIARSSLHEPSPTAPVSDLSASAYHVNITDDSGGRWLVYVYGDASEDLAYLTVDGPSGSLSGSVAGITDVCTTNRTDVEVDLLEGAFGETRCQLLDFFPGALGTNYTLEYTNGGQAEGTYDILVGSGASVNSGNFHSPGGQPFEHDALFSAVVEVTYETPDVTIRNRVGARPVASTSGSPGLAPTVDTFDVTDNSDAGANTSEYNVTWEVSDRDEDLERVRVVLVDKDDGERMSTEYTTSGDDLDPANGSDTTTMTDSGEIVDSGDKYVVRVIVIDENDNTVGVSREETVP